MSFVEKLTAAQKAYTSGEYESAVGLYTEAIEATPPGSQATLAQLSRAKSHFRAGDFLAAVNDAAEVIKRDPERVAAHQLKGEALFHAEEPESAMAAFEAALQIAPAKSVDALQKWKAATEQLLAGEPIDMAALRPLSVAATALERGIAPRKPAGAAATAAPAEPAPAPEPVPVTVVDTTNSGIDRATLSMARPGPAMKATDLQSASFTPGVPLEAPSKYRYQFFQSTTKVSVQVFIKKLNRNADRVNVDIQARRIKVEVKDEECNKVEYTLDEAMYGEVVPETAKVEIFGTQVSISMTKADDSVSWPTLEASDQKVASNWSDPAASVKQVYPSSSKKVKDWNKVEAEVKEEEKTEELGGDAALNRLFKDIYAGADEDTRRAMNKSYQESGGTSLSTNWKDVGSKTLECVPPEGVKVKKFEH